MTVAAIAARRAQYLLFAISSVRHHIELTRLESIVPWSTLHPAQERGLAGWLNYRGNPIPIIDLRQLTVGEPTIRDLGARILLLRCGDRLAGAIASDVFAIAQEEDLASSAPFDPCSIVLPILEGLRA